MDEEKKKFSELEAILMEFARGQVLNPNFDNYHKLLDYSDQCAELAKDYKNFEFVQMALRFRDLASNISFAKADVASKMIQSIGRQLNEKKLIDLDAPDMPKPFFRIKK